MDERLFDLRPEDEVIVTGTDSAGHRHDRLSGMIGCTASYRGDAVKVWPDREDSVSLECQHHCRGKIWFWPAGVESLEIVRRGDER